MPDDPADRPTLPPGRPSVQKLFAPPDHSANVTEAQRKILDGMHTGVKRLVDKYFEGAAPVVRTAILHATLDDYQDGEARGREQTVLVYQAYLDVLDAIHATMRRDARTDYVRPAVTLSELQGAIAARGALLSPQEVAKLAAEMQLALAPSPPPR